VQKGIINSLRKHKECKCTSGRGHTILTSRELMWCYTCSWDV